VRQYRVFVLDAGKSGAKASIVGMTGMEQFQAVWRHSWPLSSRRESTNALPWAGAAIPKALVDIGTALPEKIVVPGQEEWERVGAQTTHFVGSYVPKALAALAVPGLLAPVRDILILIPVVVGSLNALQMEGVTGPAKC
jgi:hypothetical protein